MRPSNLAFAYFAIVQSGSAISNVYRNLPSIFLVFDQLAEFRALSLFVISLPDVVLNLDLCSKRNASFLEIPFFCCTLSSSALYLFFLYRQRRSQEFRIFNSFDETFPLILISYNFVSNTRLQEFHIFGNSFLGNGTRVNLCETDGFKPKGKV